MENRPVPLLLLAIPVLFLMLGASSIWDANEAFYVETPRQMVTSGDYINPTFNDAPRFNKPVLSYWIVAGLYRVLGVSVGAERLGIALGALGILAGAWLIGRALRPGPTGALAALLLVTAPRILFFARRIFIDVYLAMFMTLALAFFVMAERHPQHRRRYLLLMYVALGLGVLTKGPIALAIPALAGLGWLITERRLSDIKRLMLPAGALVVIAITLPWYAAIYAQHGWEYIRFFFIDENVGRFAQPLTTSRSPAFFIFALFGDLLLPWAPLVAIALVSAWRRTQPADSSRAIRRLLWWFVVTTVVVFSISASKEDLYILPAIPAAAVLVADLLIESQFGLRHRGVQWTLVAICAVTVILGGLIAAFFTSGHYQLASAWMLAVILIAAGVAGIVQILRRRASGGTLALAAGFVAFNYLFVAVALPDIERLKPVPPLARIINDRASGTAALATLNIDLPSLVFYSNRPVRAISTIEDASRFALEHPDAWMVMSQNDWAELRQQTKGLCEAGRARLFLAKGSDIVKGQPPPDVVLATNRCR